MLQVQATENVYKGASSFERDGVTYRLTWTARGTTTSFQEKESTKVSYSVRIGDFFLHPRKQGDGTVIGCWDVPPARVRWEPLADPQIGWMLKLGGYCSGSRQSYRVLLVVPRKAKYPGFTDYVTAVFNAKETPIARWSKDRTKVRVWSSYEQWSRTARIYKFLVPELREFSDGNWNRVMVTCPPLPSDVRQWPDELPSRSFLGDYYAGILRLDAGIMRSALETYRDIDAKMMADHRKNNFLKVHREVDTNALDYHGMPSKAADRREVHAK